MFVGGRVVTLNLKIQVHQEDHGPGILPLLQRAASLREEKSTKAGGVKGSLRLRVSLPQLLGPTKNTINATHSIPSTTPRRSLVYASPSHSTPEANTSPLLEPRRARPELRWNEPCPPRGFERRSRHALQVEGDRVSWVQHFPCTR